MTHLSLRIDFFPSIIPSITYIFFAQDVIHNNTRYYVSINYAKMSRLTEVRAQKLSFLKLTTLGTIKVPKHVIAKQLSWFP